MTQLFFQIVPSKLPLGKSVDAAVLISYSIGETLKDLNGHLECGSGIKIIGDESIRIPKLHAGEKVNIPIRIKGVISGSTCLIISGLNAVTMGGKGLDFDDFELDVMVSPIPEIGTGDISFTLESNGPIVQNVIGRLIGKWHNNSSFPLDVNSLEFSADGCDIYNGSEEIYGMTIAPGNQLSFNVQIIPKLAGYISAIINSHFNILELPFSQEAKLGITVIPSNQPNQSDLSKDVWTILIITSAPINEKLIRTDKELKGIFFEIKRSAKFRDKFRIEVLPAATGDELSRAIMEWHPYIVHFAGHGTPDGIIVEDESGKSKLFPTHMLANLFHPIRDQVGCVILNACYSLIPAQEIAKSIHFVIGMQQAIVDGAAREFAKGFYEAIGAGHSIETAFQFGKAVLSNKYLNESEIPFLVIKNP